MRYHVNPQPWHVTFAHTAIEQFDVVRNFPEQRIKCVVEQFEASNIRVAQIDDDTGALSRFNARFTHGVLERLPGLGRVWFSSDAFRHTINLARRPSKQRKKA